MGETGASMFAGDWFPIQVKQSEAAFCERTGRVMRLITVREILDEMHVATM